MSTILTSVGADVLAMQRRPIHEMTAHELAAELAVLREHNDKLGAVLSAAAPSVAAIEEERDRAVIERDGLREEIEKLHGRLKKRGKNIARDASAGEHWYELTHALDPDQIKLLPLPDGKRAFLMGILDDLVIVEIPKDTPADAARGFQKFLQDQGLKSAAIVVTAGVQFMRLRRLADKESRVLDAKLQEIEAAEGSEPDGGPTSTP